jgi:hypothetical protein
MDTKIGKLLQTTQHSIKKWHFHIQEKVSLYCLNILFAYCIDDFYDVQNQGIKI